MKINDEVLEETKERIRHFLTYSIIDELENIFPDIKFEIEDRVFGENRKSTFIVQYYHDMSVNKVYLHYMLDDTTRYIHDPMDTCLRINSRLINNFHRETGIYLAIIGPTSLVKNNNMVGTNYDMSKQYLRYGVFSYWQTIDGTYQFVEDNDRVALDYYNYLINNPNVLDLMNDFNNKVLELNKKYGSFDNKKVIENAFSEYADLYKEVFGKELTPIKQSDIQYIYINLLHNIKEE